MWNPDQYNKYFKERNRPGLELISRIPESKFDSVIDLGCGDGVITKVLFDKYQPSQMSGLDSSESMLIKAKQTSSQINWQHGNIRDLAGNYDLIFSNAALQWVDNHPQLFAKLIQHTDNTLAIQVPNNFNAPSHVLLRETILENPDFKVKLVDTVRENSILREAPVLSKDAYYKILCEQMSSIDIWETEYLQLLTGDNAVLEWVRGTALVPVRERLSVDEYNEFEHKYNEKLNQVYKKLDNGVMLFPFNRIFMISTK